MNLSNKKFELNWNDEKNGIGHYISENDEYCIGQFINGVKHGKGTLYLPNGKIKQEGNWFFGIFTGNWININDLNQEYSILIKINKYYFFHHFNLIQIFYLTNSSLFQ